MEEWGFNGRMETISILKVRFMEWPNNVIFIRAQRDLRCVLKRLGKLKVHWII